MPRITNTNNAAQGYLHILLRHSNDFEHVIPTLGSQLANLPDNLRTLIDEYAQCDKKYKTVKCIDVSRTLNKYKNNKALNKAETMIKQYLNTVISSSPRKMVSLNDDRLLQLYSLNGKTLKVITGRPDFNNRLVDRKPIRPIITAYFV